MKKLLLKIIGLVFLVVAVIFGVYIFWPARSLDTNQILQQEKSALTAQPDGEQIGAKRQLQPEVFQTSAHS